MAVLIPKPTTPSVCYFLVNCKLDMKIWENLPGPKRMIFGRRPLYSAVNLKISNTLSLCLQKIRQNRQN